jgi:hypothetical protein
VDLSLLPEIERGLERLYPELDLSPIRPLAAGFGSIAGDPLGP